MKKALISFAVLVLLTSISFSKTLKDIPDSHWAAPSVYELIKAGIVDGYPDGTFRGKGKISRYESAVLAATLFSKVEISEARDEKLIAELRAEVQDLKYHFSGIIKEGEKKDIVFSGDLNSRFRMANVAFSKNKGFEFDYRLRSTMYRDFGHGIYGKINFDTMDAGFGGGTRDIAAGLIDVEGGLNFDPFSIKVNVGPGVVVHSDLAGIVPSEDNTIFIRPKSAVKLSAASGDTDFSLAYVTRNVDLSGRVGLNEITSVLGYTFNKVPLFKKLRLAVQPRFLYMNPEISDGQDSRIEFAAYISLINKIESKLLYGIGSTKDSPEGFYYNLELDLADPFGTGTSLCFRAHKVGKDYRTEDLDKYEFIPLNFFDRLVLDGTTDVGLKLTQKINPVTSVYMKGDIALTGEFKYGKEYPGTYLILEEGLSHKLSKNVDLCLSYKTFQVPSGEDQFSTIEYKTSDLLSFGLTYLF